MREQTFCGKTDDSTALFKVGTALFHFRPRILFTLFVGNRSFHSSSRNVGAFFGFFVHGCGTVINDRFRLFSGTFFSGLYFCLCASQRINLFAACLDVMINRAQFVYIFRCFRAFYKLCHALL